MLDEWGGVLLGDGGDLFWVCEWYLCGVGGYDFLGLGGDYLGWFGVGLVFNFIVVGLLWSESGDLWFYWCCVNWIDVWEKLYLVDYGVIVGDEYCLVWLGVK